ncbi:hypothetical protein IFR04_005687 [Cadophora malorum]|uniref:Phytanoyl-CoA dioxygenase n=1 Tax=Cadophora malorum TaxID=108018 RepID=A0A8H7W9T8_9HELO|nr:hypothetical protein IFR04_005687 [Cadophora malorum]
MPHAQSVATESLIVSAKTAADWKNDLARNGYVVVKNVISEEKAAYYVDQMQEWLEGFGLGYNRSDKSTWKPENLPANMKGGMYHDYAVAHESFNWEARMEPGVLDVFSQIWNTEELLVSFDGINLTPPIKNPDTAKWPHIDQSPNRLGLECIQGILNFNPNGPEDGGLTVLRGSHTVVPEFFKTHKVTNMGSWGFEDFYMFDDEQQEWFAEKGCETVKVCVGPGDLILWDSRTVHYNVPPRGEIVRALLYVCLTPASFATPGSMKQKKAIFEMWGRTTHWPHANLHLDHKVPRRNGVPDPLNRTEPIKKPILSDKLLKLAGAMPY